MGAWLLATTLWEIQATRLSKLAVSDETATGVVLNLAEQAAKYAELYEFLFKLGVGSGIVLLLLTPFLKKLMHGIH